MLLRKAGIALFAVAVTCVLFINYCDLMYNCGCTWLWAGAADHCNIHNPQGRHCPWCTIGLTGSLLVWLFMVIPQVAIAFWPASWSMGKRLLLAVLAFPVAGLIPGVTLGLWHGYWN